MRKTFFLFTLLCTLTAWNQNLSEGRRYFDNYEYEDAAVIFQKVYDKNNRLEEEDLRRLVYSYYVIGEYEACQPLSNELIASVDKIEPLFHLISGDVNRGVGNYSKAIESYEKYQSLTDEEDVSLKIKSCRNIVNWDDEEYVTFGELPRNKKMADLTSGTYNGKIIHFNEIGFDKMQEMIGVVQSDNSVNAELLLSQPSIYNQGQYHSVFMKDSSLASITSISFLPNSKKALITASYPLAKSALKRAPNLYWATMTEDHLFDEVVPFEYSGFADTTSTAHATIHPSGSIIIFTKIGKRTRNGDLYQTDKTDSGWSTPKQLDKLNTDGDEMFPTFSGDSLLYFSSNGRVGYGGLDIYRSPFPLESDEIIHYKSPINSFKDDFSFTYITEDSAIFVSNRTNGTGDDDLYYITFQKEVIETVDTFNVNDFVAEWKVKNVYFEFDKFTLKNALSTKNIEEIKMMLDSCANCTIELTGYTDSRGSSSYNMNLSKKRAKTVQDALSKEDVDTSRITIIPKGETDQPYDCGNECSDEQHKLNRVVEIDVKLP